MFCIVEGSYDSAPQLIPGQRVPPLNYLLINQNLSIMAIFMHQITNNTIVCVSEPLDTVKKSLNGKEVYTRTQANRTFGLLCLMDASGKTLDPRSLGLKKGDEIPGFDFSDAPVLDQTTKEETGLFWVEAK